MKRGSDPVGRRYAVMMVSTMTMTKNATTEKTERKTLLLIYA